MWQEALSTAGGPGSLGGRFPAPSSQVGGLLTAGKTALRPVVTSVSFTFPSRPGFPSALLPGGCHNR